MEKWRWNPDAKCIKNKNGGSVLLNYAFSSVKKISNEDGKIVSNFSGLTIPFTINQDVNVELRDYLVNNLFVIPELDYANYNELTLKRLKTALHNSYGLIIMPTEKCNFRCTYCYESFERGKMSDENALALCESIKTIATTAPNFSLGFFGGEPLLWPDLILKFSSLAFGILKNRNLPYFAGISTNGYFLTLDLFRKLVEVGVTSYQISIDGTEEVHDKQRLTISKKPTFKTIIANLRAMASTDYQFNCVIRCNISPTEGKKAIALFSGSEVDFIKQDKRFIVDIHQIWKSDRETMLESNEAPGCGSEFYKTLDTYILYKSLNDLGVSNVAYSSIPSLLSSACYAGKPNWYVIGSNLNIYKCTVVFDNEKNKLGYVDKDGTLVIDAQKNELWTGSNVLTDNSCSTCHYRIPCGGVACPLKRFTDGVKSCPEIKHPAVLQKWANQL
ncbi:radical SAM protein [Segetibacter sp. 3557_3]|uniref:radical SAM/SPASM domain-containing protein n=1 Tax=Segetibacter sp. 3557_3 TaxID=2547429 RepID=UPI0010584340|nr:radical SAM protein [Segetibacter sp. 3557_3]TDH18039.1 radical SAM protein [Segetibacter sp. 3557_3]